MVNGGLEAAEAAKAAEADGEKEAEEEEEEAARKWQEQRTHYTCSTTRCRSRC